MTSSLVLRHSFKEHVTLLKCHKHSAQLGPHTGNRLFCDQPGFVSCQRLPGGRAAWLVSRG